MAPNQLFLFARSTDLNMQADIAVYWHASQPPLEIEFPATLPFTNDDVALHIVFAPVTGKPAHDSSQRASNGRRVGGLSSGGLSGGGRKCRIWSLRTENPTGTCECAGGFGTNRFDTNAVVNFRCCSLATFSRLGCCGVTANVELQNLLRGGASLGNTLRVALVRTTAFGSVFQPRITSTGVRNVDVLVHKRARISHLFCSVKGTAIGG